MTDIEILEHRLNNQQIIRPRFRKPEEVIGWLGAMQGQEYNQTLWSIGQRLPKPQKNEIEKAFNDGKIVRTHILRPTWHFVKAEDLLWMLSVSGPRVNATNAYYYNQLGLDDTTFKQSQKVIAKALEGNNHLTRNELKSALEKKKIIAEGHRLAYIIMRAELDGLICSGPRIGKQFTYALISERISNPIILKKEEALGRLTKVYFASRGPATLQDFVWWSGLTMADARKGVEMVKGDFIKETIHGKEYILLPASFEKSKTLPSFLLSTYDEYGIAYKNRSALADVKNETKGIAYINYFVIEGKIAGAWKKTVQGKQISIETIPFQKLSKAKEAALKNAVDNYLAFETQTA